MSADVDWTAPWAAKKLVENRHVAHVKVVGPGRLRITRVDRPLVTVATLAADNLSLAMLRQTLDSPPPPDFLLNLRSNGIIAPEAFQLALAERLPIGRLGDLERALELESVREYRDRETMFRERGLEQHKKVTEFTQMDPSRYYIERIGLPPIMVVFNADYELAADAVRQARQDYGEFDILVAVNPNGRITESAAAVAEDLGIEVHQWRAFLARLHRAER